MLSLQSNALRRDSKSFCDGEIVPAAHVCSPFFHLLELFRGIFFDTRHGHTALEQFITWFLSSFAVFKVFTVLLSVCFLKLCFCFDIYRMLIHSSRVSSNCEFILLKQPLHCLTASLHILISVAWGLLCKMQTWFSSRAPRLGLRRVPRHVPQPQSSPLAPADPLAAAPLSQAFSFGWISACGVRSCCLCDADCFCTVHIRICTRSVRKHIKAPIHIHDTTRHRCNALSHLVLFTCRGVKVLQLVLFHWHVKGAPF